MVGHMSNMTGEELLLVTVLGGPLERHAVEQELDRRALSGPPQRRPRRPQHEPPAIRYSARLVA